MNPLKLIIFDCDGVLVDSETISNRLVAELLQEQGIPMTKEESHRQFAGTSLEYIRNYIHQLTGQVLREDFEQVYRKRSHIAFAEELQPIKGVAEAIEAIPLARCVASNGPQEKIITNLKITGLSAFFADNLFSAYDIQRWKPEPDLYLHAATRMKVPTAHCVVVEDSTAGVRAARSAGMRVLGYGGSGNGDRLQAAGATHVFEHMEELPRLIGNL